MTPTSELQRERDPGNTLLTADSPTFTAQAPSLGPSRLLAAWQDSRPGCCPRGARPPAVGEQLRRSGEHDIYTETGITTRSWPGEKVCLGSRPGGEGAQQQSGGPGRRPSRCRENRRQIHGLCGSASSLALSLRRPRALRWGQIHQVGLFKDILWPLCKEWVGTEVGSCGGDHGDSSRTEDELNPCRREGRLHNVP